MKAAAPAAAAENQRVIFFTVYGLPGLGIGVAVAAGLAAPFVS